MNDIKEKETNIQTRTGSWPEVRSIPGETDEHNEDEPSSDENV